ncbi:MAG: bifunctional oligoribonuclease/PAP phosphatase NrnA [Chloroflexi bacterium]|nr:MAG: bifunctional oligoribonuclease/PAP phosphatase NrnA [Chloroflexota bacterium]
MRDRILHAQRLVLLTHSSPDADAVGSLLAMASLCRRLGRAPVAMATGDHAVPDNLRFLDGALGLTNVDDQAIIDADLLIFMDCSDPSRLGPLYYRLQPEFERRRDCINIDHHVTNDRFGSLNLVVPAAAATSEIVTRIYQSLDMGIEPGEATTLLAGIYGDTLGLRTPSTTPSTLRVSAELIEAGGDVDTVVDYLFRLKPFSTIALWGEALSHVQWRGALIWTAIYPEMLAKTGATRAEGEGIVNFLAGALGARAACLLYLEPWGWRVSLRSLADDVDVAWLAKRHGGGGHTRAAGCRLEPGEAQRERFLDDIAAQLGPAPDHAITVSSGDEPV